MKSSFIILLLFSQLIYSQSTIINDTLSMLSFEDIRLKLLQHLENDEKFKTYVDYYIKKAKKEENTEHLIKGYGFKVEGYPFKEAIKNADSMYTLVKGKEPKFLFLYYYKLGNLYSGNRKNKKGLEYYLLAYKNCNVKEENYYNAIKMQIGVMRSTLGQDLEAISILKETESYFKENSPIHYLFQQYVLAEVYNSLLELETAKRIIDKGIVLSKKNKSDLMHDRFIATKGVNLYYRKEYDKALVSLLTILKNADYVKEDFSDFAFVSYYIGKSYEGLKNKELAFKYFKKVDSIFVKYNDVYSWNIDAYKFLISYCRENKDLKEQLVYTERLIKADSLLLNSNEFAFKKINKEFDIPNLISDKEIIIKKLKTKDMFLKIIISVLIIITSFLCFVFYKNKKKNKEKIELLKNDLEKYLSIQNRKFEDKNKLFISESLKNQDSNFESQGKMSDSAKENILNCLSSFEKNKEYINNNCSLENLAKDFNTNKSYLSKVINEVKGYSFSTYINNLRIDYVIHLLKEDKKIRKYSIESISEEVGYNNAKAFSKAFYDRVQMKPSVFIKNMKV